MLSLLSYPYLGNPQTKANPNLLLKTENRDFLKHSQIVFTQVTEYRKGQRKCCIWANTTVMNKEKKKIPTEAVVNMLKERCTKIMVKISYILKIRFSFDLVFHNFTVSEGSLFIEVYWFFLLIVNKLLWRNSH